MKAVTVRKILPAFTDQRGSISDLLNEPISHVGWITTRKGAVRASHYHRKSRQYSYIVSGEFEVITAPKSMPSRVTLQRVRAGELITIQPNTIHRFKALKNADMVDMISESRKGGSYEGDVVRVTYEGGRFSNVS